MSSLKIETPRVAPQRRAPEQKATPTTPSNKGIVPPAPKAPKRDGFEQMGLPGKTSMGSGLGSSSSGTPKAASLAYIGASGTKGQPSGLSQEVMDQIHLDAVDIASRLPDMTHSEFRDAVHSAVDALGLETTYQKKLAQHELYREVRALAADPGSGGSGNKHFGAERVASQVDSGATSGAGKSTPPGTEPSKALGQHKPALKKLARKLAGDSNLRTGAQVRKAAWAEIKKMGLGETERQEARSFVLEQLEAQRRRSR